MWRVNNYDKKILQIYIVVFSWHIISFLSKKEKEVVKGREYITESGFSFETTQETKVIETTTEVFDIKKHPEMWSMTDKETYQYILEDVLDSSYGNNYLEKLPLSEKFINSQKRDIFDYVEPINRVNGGWEKYAGLFDPDFDKQLIWCFTWSDTIVRNHLLKYNLDEHNNLDEIQVLKTELVEDKIAESIAESIANRPTSYDDLERYKKVIPELFYPLEYGKLDDFDEEEQKDYFDKIRNRYKNYEGYTDSFSSKYDIMEGILGNKVRGAAEYEDLTDLSNKCIGVVVTYWNDKKEEYYDCYYKVYFEVDDRNFLDSITKVEEVLEDGTVVEVENNFGKQCVYDRAVFKLFICNLMRK